MSPRTSVRTGPWPAVGVLAALVTVGVAALTVLGRLQQVPVIFPDELIYGGMADSLARGEGATFRGADPGLSSLFPYLLGVAWGLGSSVPDGYEFAKLLTAVLYGLALIPLWLALKEPLGRWVALLPCVLLLIGPWSGDSSKLLTESLAFPIVTAAIAMLWWGLRGERRSHPKILLAFAFAGIAVMVRLQLVILVPAFVLAIATDSIARFPAHRSQRLRRFAPELIAFTLATIVAAIYVFASRSSSLGVYATVRDFSIGIDALQRTIEYIAMFPVYGMLLPPIAFFALVSSKSAWRDPQVGPLIAILSTLGVTLAVTSGWFVAGVDTTVVERYLIYLIPWLLALPFFGLRLLRASGALIATVVTAILVLIPVSVASVATAESFEGGRHLFGSFFGVLSTGSPVITLMLAMVVGLAYAVVVSSPASAPPPEGDAFDAQEHIERFFGAARARVNLMSRVSAALGLTIFVALLAAPVSEWRWSQVAATSDQQIAALPSDLDWVDDAVEYGRSVSLVSFGNEVAGVPLIYTDFFNGSVDRVLSQSPSQLVAMPGLCQFDIDDRGALAPKNSCAEPPTAVVVFGSATQVSVIDPAVVVSQPKIGRLAFSKVAESSSVGSQEPVALKSLISEPCQPNGQCADNLVVRLWLRDRAQLKVKFAGTGGDGFSVSVGGRDYEIPANGQKTIAIDVPSGAQEIKIELGWATTALSPRLESVELRGEEIYAINGD